MSWRIYQNPSVDGVDILSISKQLKRQMVTGV